MASEQRGETDSLPKKIVKMTVIIHPGNTAGTGTVDDTCMKS